MFKSNEVNSRQTSLRLRTYKYAIVIGVGGVGSWVAFNLGLSGQIDTLIIFDDDAVETSNLNRTPYRIDHIGIDKVEAIKELILERRVMNVVCFSEKFREDSIEMLKNLSPAVSPIFNPKNTIIFDCRDEIFKDLKTVDCKKWKVGYDGMDITIDGNPDETIVMGVSNGYTITPSFICPSQLLANLVITNALSDTTWFDDEKDPLKDKFGQFNKIVTINSSTLLSRLYHLENPINEVNNGSSSNRKKSSRSKKEKGQHNDQEECGRDIVEQLCVSTD